MPLFLEAFLFSTSTEVSLKVENLEEGEEHDMDAFYFQALQMETPNLYHIRADPEEMCKLLKFWIPGMKFLTMIRTGILQIVCDNHVAFLLLKSGRLHKYRQNHG